MTSVTSQAQQYSQRKLRLKRISLQTTAENRQWLCRRDVMWQTGRVPFPSIITIWGGGTLWAIIWRWGNGVPLRSITL